MKRVSDCIFCQIIDRKKNSYIVAENIGAIAILDAFSVSEGHALIISKNHAKNITELEQDDWNNLFIAKNNKFSFFQTVVNKLQQALKPKGFNFISNMGEEAYQSIFHFHLHIIPKYQKDQGFIWTVRNKNEQELDKTNEKLKKIN